ncbi:hypothetical protein A2U01_0097079, partial [Trifolium medium]|nr:hypothetical protein [Trifolium medium]
GAWAKQASLSPIWVVFAASTTEPDKGARARAQGRWAVAPPLHRMV